jgi:long-subunit fatty acid transport protein
MAVPRLLTLAVSCTAAAAWASPRSDPTAGRAVFTGAATPHATSIGLDPAALGQIPFDQLYVAITGVLDQLHATVDRFDGTTLAPGSRVSDVEIAPGAVLAFIYHLAGDSFTLGFEARTTPPETFPGQTAWQYHVSGGGERDWLASVAASYKVTGDLFFGASLSHQNTFLRLHYTRDTALDSPQGPATPCGSTACGFGNPDAAERWGVDVSSPTLSTSNFKVNIGVMYQVRRDIWLGVAYHTPPGLSVQSELGGKIMIGRAPRDQALGDPAVLVGQSVVEIQLPASVDAEVRAGLPRDLELHVGGRWEDLSRLQAYDVRAYGSTLPRYGIPEWTERPRGMRDAFAGWAGVEQRYHGQTDKVVLFGARAGFETAAVSTERTSPLTVVPASLTLDLGAQLRLPGGVIAQLSYGLQYFPTVNVQTSEFDPQSRVDCTASNYDYTTRACAAVRNGYAIAPATGTYDRIEHAVRLGLRYDFP